MLSQGRFLCPLKDTRVPACRLHSARILKANSRDRNPIPGQGQSAGQDHVGARDHSGVTETPHPLTVVGVP